MPCPSDSVVGYRFRHSIIAVILSIYIHADKYIADSLSSNPIAMQGCV
jgi:hypothetical protein